MVFTVYTHHTHTPHTLTLHTSHHPHTLHMHTPRTARTHKVHPPTVYERVRMAQALALEADGDHRSLPPPWTCQYSHGLLGGRQLVIKPSLPLGPMPSHASGIHFRPNSAHSMSFSDKIFIPAIKIESATHTHTHKHIRNRLNLRARRLSHSFVQANYALGETLTIYPFTTTTSAYQVQRLRGCGWCNLTDGWGGFWSVMNNHFGSHRDFLIIVSW